MASIYSPEAAIDYEPHLDYHSILKLFNSLNISCYFIYTRFNIK